MIKNKIALSCGANSGKAVFSAIDSVPYFELRPFTSPNLDQTPLFLSLLFFPVAFAQQRKSVTGYFVVFVAMPTIRKTNGSVGTLKSHVISSAFVTAEPFC